MAARGINQINIELLLHLQDCNLSEFLTEEGYSECEARGEMLECLKTIGLAANNYYYSQHRNPLNVQKIQASVISMEFINFKQPNDQEIIGRIILHLKELFRAVSEQGLNLEVSG